MPRHLATGVNVGALTAVFSNSKVAVVDISIFGFTKPPIVTLTPNDSGTVPPYKSQVTATQVTVRLKTPWTGSIDVGVTER